MKVRNPFVFRKPAPDNITPQNNNYFIFNFLLHGRVQFIGNIISWNFLGTLQPDILQTVTRPSFVESFPSHPVSET